MSKLVLLFFAFSVCALPRASLGQDSSTSRSSKSSNYSKTAVAENLQTRDTVTAKLTLGQQKAVKAGYDLALGNAVVFDKKGEPIKHGSTKMLEKVFKECKDPKPISDRCWLCSNGNIFCKNPPK